MGHKTLCTAILLLGLIALVAAQAPCTTDDYEAQYCTAFLFIYLFICVLWLINVNASFQHNAIEMGHAI